jgi:hypothetical protein
LAVVILGFAAFRAVAHPSPATGDVFGGILWVLSFLGDLWPYALLSTPLLVLGWRRVQWEEASKQRTAGEGGSGSIAKPRS